MESHRDRLVHVAHFIVDRLKERSTARALVVGAAGLVGVAVSPGHADLWAGLVSVLAVLIAVFTEEKPPC